MQRFFTLILLICFNLALAVAYPEAMITAPVQGPAVLTRRDSADNPLSELISEGISAGDSILSGFLSPGASSSSTSSPSPTPTSKPTVSTNHVEPSSRKPLSLTPRPTKSESSHATAPTATKSSGHLGASKSVDNNNNNHLIIILAAVIGVLVIALTAIFLWVCIKRRRRQGYEKSDDSSSLESSPPTRFPTLPRLQSLKRSRKLGDLNRGMNDIPAPPATMVESSKKRTYMPYRSPDDTSSSETPFFTPPLHPDGMSRSGMQNNRASLEIDGTPISPITPSDVAPTFPAAPVEIDGTNVPRVPRRSSRRSRVYYPSIGEVSRFDFGFNKDRHAYESAKRRPASYNIPRRPVGM